MPPAPPSLHALAGASTADAATPAPDPSDAITPALRGLVAEAAGPQAGQDTPARFRWLAAVCAEDLVLGKLFEAHLDALAILDELPLPPAAAPWRDEIAASGGLWAVWAAEGPAVLQVLPALPGLHGAAPLRVRGRKSWCSGARRAAAALVTARDADGRSRMVAVPLSHPGVRVTGEGWDAVGMAGTESVDTVFDNVPAWPVGAPGDYVARTGFWHGAAGIAACWQGAAAALAEPLRQRVARQGDAAGELLCAHLGAVDAALGASAVLLRQAARDIDRHRAGEGPAFGRREALAVRAAVEHAASRTLDHVGQALGAGPLCRDAAHARRAADLTVFLRQSHAQWDLAALGRLAAACRASATPDQPSPEKDTRPWMP